MVVAKAPSDGRSRFGGLPKTLKQVVFQYLCVMEPDAYPRWLYRGKAKWCKQHVTLVAAVCKEWKVLLRETPMSVVSGVHPIDHGVLLAYRVFCFSGGFDEDSYESY